MTTPTPPEQWDWDDVPAPAGVLTRAVEQRDTRLLAAAARLGAALPADARPLLAPLADLGLRVVDLVAPDTGGRGLGLAPTTGLLATADLDPPPPLLTSMRPRRSLVGALAACRVPGSDHPYPGRTATVAEVVEALGATGDDGRVRHVKGGLRTLAVHDLVVLVDDRVDHDAPVRLGPAVAAWDEPWVREELPALLDALAAAVRP